MNQDEKELEIVSSEKDGNEEMSLITDSDNTTHHHHHHHHHHHKHHSKLYYKYRNVKHQFKKIFRKKAVRFTFAFLLPVIALAVILTVAIGNSQLPEPEKAPAATVSSEDEAEQKVSILFSDVTSPQYLVMSALRDYMTVEDTTEAWNNIRTTDTQAFKGIPVQFSYQTGRLPLNTTVREAYVLVSKDKNLSSPLRYDFDTHCNAYANTLETGQTYYYEIRVVLSDDNTVKTSGSFETALTPRLIGFDGPVNVRDIGGWTTTDKKQIKEGLLYRGSELDGKVEPSYKLSDQDFITMHKNLGIVYDCDLRSPAENSSGESALGQSVAYRLYNVLQYRAAFSDAGKASMKALFTDLSDARHYPMYMHCAYGKDRTGTACFLLEALLGMSKEDVIKEYQLSNLTYGDSEQVSIDSEFGRFIIDFEQLPGDNYREKAENYLLSCGLSEATLEKIKDIFLN